MPRETLDTLISRDPFARTELHRFNSRHLGQGLTCDWCGSKGRQLKFDWLLYRYTTETDGGSMVHDGVFCCKSCHDSYHS
jgi:hypothetical protein